MSAVENTSRSIRIGRSSGPGDRRPRFSRAFAAAVHSIRIEGRMHVQPLEAVPRQNRAKRSRNRHATLGIEPVGKVRDETIHALRPRPSGLPGASGPQRAAPVGVARSSKRVNLGISWDFVGRNRTGMRARTTQIAPTSQKSRLRLTRGFVGLGERGSRHAALGEVDSTCRPRKRQRDRARRAGVDTRLLQALTAPLWRLYENRETKVCEPGCIGANPTKVAEGGPVKFEPLTEVFAVTCLPIPLEHD